MRSVMKNLVKFRKL